MLFEHTVRGLNPHSTDKSVSPSTVTGLCHTTIALKVRYPLNSTDTAMTIIHW
jgi:hypothetical protein